MAQEKSTLPSWKQDTPLGRDLESNSERTLWSNFMGQCLFRKKSWKERGAGDSLDPAWAEQKEVASSDYDQQSCSQQTPNSPVRKAEKAQEKLFQLMGSGKEGRQPHLIWNTSTGSSEADSFLCARGGTAELGSIGPWASKKTEFTSCAAVPPPLYPSDQDSPQKHFKLHLLLPHTEL